MAAGDSYVVTGPCQATVVFQLALSEPVKLLTRLFFPAEPIPEPITHGGTRAVLKRESVATMLKV